MKIAEKGNLTLGWTVVRVDLLKKEPIQCFRCWRFGHVQTSCKSEVDRKGSCFRCGFQGHSVRDCSALPRCVICADNNLDSRHRIGTPRCLQNQGFPNGIQQVRRITDNAGGGTGHVRVIS